MSVSGHILIIDDEAPLRQTLARILQRAGFSVTSAGNAKEGLDLLFRQPFDLIYLDIRMPDMTGLEALKIIQARFPDLAVILFTAQPDLNSAVEALRNGAVDYLLKPLKPETLIERTRSILSKLERENHKKEIQSQIATLQAELKDMENESPVSKTSAVAGSLNHDERYLRRGKLTLDLHARRVTIGDRLVTLSPTSFDYLLVLMHHAPNVVDYQTLAAEAQGYEADMREAQELAKWHVHHIREAIEPDQRNPIYLINVRGTGYRLVAD
jgi:DNA-binding response OmpR family regulator